MHTSRRLSYLALSLPSRNPPRKADEVAVNGQVVPARKLNTPSSLDAASELREARC